MNGIKEKSKRNILIAIIVILAVAIIGTGVGLVYNNFFAEKPEEPKGVVGIISDGWETGLEDKTSPPRQGIQIPGYGTAEMKEDDTSLSLSIGNPKTNKCGFYATLKLEDGTVLYESELLKPGYGLTEIPLNQTLKVGEYTAIVYYRCVTLDESHSPLNSAESEFKLIVK